MFDSKISAKEIVDAIIAEEDTVIEIPEEYYYQWIDSEEQLLYNGVIKEERLVKVDITHEGILLSDIEVPEGEESISPEDIYRIYCDKRELEKTNFAAFVSLPCSNTFCIDNNILYLNCSGEKADIIYFAKPKRKWSENGINNANIALPYEFIDLIRCRLRGEKYRLSNDEVLCAKWINEYNSLLENFKSFLKKAQNGFTA